MGRVERVRARLPPWKAWTVPHSVHVRAQLAPESAASSGRCRPPHNGAASWNTLACRCEVIHGTYGRYIVERCKGVGKVVSVHQRGDEFPGTRNGALGIDRIDRSGRFPGPGRTLGLGRKDLVPAHCHGRHSCPVSGPAGAPVRVACPSSNRISLAAPGLLQTKKGPLHRPLWWAVGHMPCFDRTTGGETLLNCDVAHTRVECTDRSQFTSAAFHVGEEPCLNQPLPHPQQRPVPK